MKKQLTVSGCCDIVNISQNTQIVKFGKHSFMVAITHCTNCGAVKATSNIKEVKNGKNDYD